MLGVWAVTWGMVGDVECWGCRRCGDVECWDVDMGYGR